MDYGEIVYRLGKQYGKALETCAPGEYPMFEGHLSELAGRPRLDSLPELLGEYLISYRDLHGTNHFIRVYFDEGHFQVTGTPATDDLHSMNIDISQD